MITAWQSVREHYRYAFSPSTEQREIEAAQRYCEDNLLGVALLILDDALQRHHNTIALDLYENPNRVGRVVFNAEEKILFNIRDTMAIMPQVATFYRFRPALDGQMRKPENWSLRLDKPSPYLLQIQPLSDSHPEFRNNPVFAVYGIAHGNACTTTGQPQAWVEEFADVFLGKSPDPLKETALFNGIHARFLINDHVFETMDSEASHLRLELQSQVMRYFEAKEDRLKEIPNSVLEAELRQMDNLMIRTNYMLGRLQQAITTLTINREIFKQRWAAFPSEYPRWQLSWQPATISLEQSPLLASFQSHLDNLNHHVAYLQGKLTHLHGAHDYWHSYLSEQRHDFFKHLGYLGHLIIFLVALTKMGELFSHGGPKISEVGLVTFILNHPLFYLVILIGYLFFFVGRPHYKEWQKRRKYHKHKSRGNA